MKKGAWAVLVFTTIVSPVNALSKGARPPVYNVSEG